MMRRLLCCAVLLHTVACVDVGQESVHVPLSIAFASPGEPFEVRSGYRVTLESARMVFGPLYLCASSTAGEACERARVEWTGSALVNALDPQPQAVAMLSGIEGQVRSWMYDLGLPSLLTTQQPLVTDAAREIDGASLQLVGFADSADASVRLPFHFEVAVKQTDATEKGISVIRKGIGDATLDYDIRRPEPSLTLHFDAKAWFASLDFSTYRRNDTCVKGGALVVCTGNIEQRCSADGIASSQIDCAQRSQICAPEVGCVSKLTAAEDSQAWRAIRNDVVAGARPRFEWNAP